MGDNSTLEVKKELKIEENIFKEAPKVVTMDQGQPGDNPLQPVGLSVVKKKKESFVNESIEDLINRTKNSQLKILLDAPMRNAVNMKKTQVDQKDMNLYNLDYTKRESDRIQRYLDEITSENFSVEEREKTQAKLEMMLGRDKAHLLLNDRKLGGDSKYMAKVKEDVQELENALKDSKMDVIMLSGMYLNAIESCTNYLKNQSNWIKSWSERKTMVSDILERLKNEAQLLELGMLLYLNEEHQDMEFKNGLELISAARIYELGCKMGKHKREEGSNDHPVNKTTLKAARRELEELPIDKNAKEILAIFKTGSVDVSRLMRPKTKKNSKLSKNEKQILSDMRGLRSALYDFNAGEAKIQIVKIGDQQMRLVQQEDNSLSIVGTFGNIFLGSVSKVLKDMDNDIIDHMEYYNDMDDVYMAIMDIPDAVGIKSIEELTRERNFLSSLIAKKTGYKNSDFDNFSFADLKAMSYSVLSNTLTKESLDEQIKKANEHMKTSVNTQKVLEMRLATHANGGTVTDKTVVKEKESAWPPEEQKVLDLISELIFSEDTRQMDLQSSSDARLMGKRVVSVLMKNADAVAILVREAYNNQLRKEAGEDPLPTTVEKILEKTPLMMLGEDGIGEVRDALTTQISVIVNDITEELKEQEDTLQADYEAEMMQIDEAGGAGKTLKQKFASGKKIAKQAVINGTRTSLKDGGKSLESMLFLRFKGMLDTEASRIKNLYKEPEDKIILRNRRVVKQEPKQEKPVENKNDMLQKFGEMQTMLDNKIADSMKEIGTIMDKVTEKIFGSGQKTEQTEKGSPLSDEERARQNMEQAKSRLEGRKKTLEDKKRRAKELKEQYDNAKDKKDTKKWDPILKEYKELKDYIDNHTKNEAKKLVKEMADVAVGDKGQGLFLRNVLNSYFNEVSLIDKKSMVASALRSAKPLEKGLDMKALKEGDSQSLAAFSDFLGGMFKGAGPLFQKLLQGMPTSAIPEGLKKSIDDMKDSLSPIPEEIVKEKLDSIILNSKGEIDDIKIVKSLGAASVGQAFLCKLYGRGYDPEGKEVVIKILRPDAKNRMLREKEIMENAAIKTDSKDLPKGQTRKGGMYATFQGTFKRIEEELDLTIESNNIEMGNVYNKTVKGFKYDKGKVKSMNKEKGIPSQPDILVIEKAEGETVKKYLDDIRKKTDELVGSFYEKERKQGNVVYKKTDLGDLEVHKIKDSTTFFNAPDIYRTIPQLEGMIQTLRKRQKYMLELAEKWSHEGIFGEGFYHGDLHAGNIMVNDEGLTVIDFGNATKLDEAQRVQITKMMVAACDSDEEAFLDGFHNLLENTDEKTWNLHKEELKWIFADVLSMADEGSVAERVSVALLKAQEAGLELPPAIANFVNSQMRLQNTIEDMNNLIYELSYYSHSLRAMGYDKDSSVPEGANLCGVPQIMYANFKKIGKVDQKSTIEVTKKLGETFGIDEYGNVDEKRFNAYKDMVKKNFDPVFDIIKVKAKADGQLDEKEKKEAKKNNLSKINAIKCLLNPLNDDPEYGEELKEKYLNYRQVFSDFMENPQKSEEADKVLNPLKEEIYDLYYKIQQKMAIDCMKNLANPEEKEEKPETFFGVMGNVMKNSWGTTLKRVGILKAVGIGMSNLWYKVSGVFKSKSKDTAK